MTCQELASRIDHTLLRPDATESELLALCREAAEFETATVCVNPAFVPLCREQLTGTSVGVCTVVGFPLGAMETASKAFEALLAVRAGAAEIDMVLPLGPLKSGREDAVRRDIAAVVEASSGRTVKVILETCLLSDAEIVTACRLSAEAGAHFVKTSTGFSRAGATAEHVRLMKASSQGLLVKAAGGIRTLAQAMAMLEAGADRLGCSATSAILAELTNQNRQ